MENQKVFKFVCDFLLNSSEVHCQPSFANDTLLWCQLNNLERDVMITVTGSSADFYVETTMLFWRSRHYGAFERREQILICFSLLLDPWIP